MKRMHMRALILILFFQFHTIIELYAQDNADSTRQSKIYTVYDRCALELDRGDTAKRRAETSGWCAYVSLDHIARLDDKYLFIASLSTPCLSTNSLNKKYLQQSQAGRSNTTEKVYMPDIDSFTSLPFQMIVPNSTLNLGYFNLKGATGRLIVINRATILNTQGAGYRPYSEYGMNLQEFLEFAKATDDEYGLLEHINYTIGDQNSVDLFGTYFRSTFGVNASFAVNHMWGVHITPQFIVLLENIQNGLWLNDAAEEDFSEQFIKMAESIKPISPSAFDLNKLDEYRY